MGLQNYRLGQTRALGGTEQTMEGPGGVRTIDKFFPPIQGVLIDGAPVRITLLADVPGHSLANWCIDANGQQGFVSIDAVRVTDPNYLPAATPAMGQQDTAKQAVTR